jgi:hypothetical protein
MECGKVGQTGSEESKKNKNSDSKNENAEIR